MRYKFLLRIFFVVISLMVLCGCSSSPKVNPSKIAYMEIFIPSQFVPEEKAIEIQNINFDVFIDGKIFGQRLQLEKSGFGRLYTLLNPYRGHRFGSRSLSDTAIPFPQGWHEITVVMRQEGKEFFVPLRLTGKKTSSY
ncbi:MAG: hypothetical protein JW928_08640, partial [Candidatus Aureabacteria bacterium]|nr:hypothetical protein [Candidatus Auribacterota bacterium]